MSGRNVLIVGSGAREHALAWKLRQSPHVADIVVAPGNPGTGTIAHNVPVPAVDVEALARLAEEREIDLTVIGPEAPLALGLADRIRARGRLVVGPDAGAARIESSKAFAKEIMRRAGVPTPHSAAFDRVDQALQYLESACFPQVIKADGLAAGKGVTVCGDLSEACRVVWEMMVEAIHGEAGRRVVIEEYLIGPEISLLALVDGERIVLLPAAQDHKRLCDGDLGPNTGGMGAYAPVPFVNQAEVRSLSRLVLEPVVRELMHMATPYRGVLFAGLMLTEQGPKVLEYNCRFGDPEAQVILPLLSDDLFPWLEAVAAGALPDTEIPVHPGMALGVVLAAPGYPEKPRLEAPVEGLEKLAPGVLAFHGGTAVDADGRIVTSGGRVLTLVSRAATADAAAESVYAAPVHFAGMQRRTDIAWQARVVPAPSQPAIDLPRIVVLASGDGSNLQALLGACVAGSVEAQIVGVISDKPGAGALARAGRAGIPAVCVPLSDRRDPEARAGHEEEVLRLVRTFQPDLLVLAGWMLILSNTFLAGCPCPLINVHPALLPGDGPELDPLPEQFPVLRGAHAVRDALLLGLPCTGVSVHEVTAEVDGGPVIAREAVPVEPWDDMESLYRRIKAVEHRLLPRAVQKMLYSAHVRGGVYA